MFVDAVIGHCVAVVGAPKEGAGQEGLGTPIQSLFMLFYNDDGLVAPPESACLQEASDALTGLFNRVGLRTNEGKTVIMACRPCHTPHA